MFLHWRSVMLAATLSLLRTAIQSVPGKVADTAVGKHFVDADVRFASNLCGRNTLENLQTTLLFYNFCLTENL